MSEWPTLNELRIIKQIGETPNTAHYGLALADAAGLSTPSTYLCLNRLEKKGWLTARWEDLDPVEAGRPARQYFQLTAAGLDGYWRSLRAVIHPSIWQDLFGEEHPDVRSEGR